jgi:hypothetical protein
VESSDPLGFEGTKTFEQVVVPQNSEVKELPEFTFSFFDPEQKQYRTLNHPAIPLTVRPSGAAPQPTIFSNNPDAKTEQPARDIVHIKPRLGAVGGSSLPLVQQPGFWILQSVAPLLWIFSVLYRKRADSLQNNPRLRRQREVEQTVSRGMKELSQFAVANDSERFFATTFRLLQEQIGERLDVPASAITEAVLEDRLRPLGVDPETLAMSHELFQACNQARYASQRKSEELTSMIPKVERVLQSLRKIE